MPLVQFLRKSQNSVCHRDFTHMLSHVCELISPRHVTGSIDVFLRRAAAIVNNNVLFGGLDTGVLESQVFDIGLAPDSRDNSIAWKLAAIVQYCDWCIVNPFPCGDAVPKQKHTATSP